MERDPWLRTLIVLLVIIAGWYLVGQAFDLAGRFSDLLLVLFLSWLLAFILGPFARLLQHRLRLPRLGAIVLVYLGLIVAVFGGGVMLVPIAALQIDQLSKNVSTFAVQLSDWLAVLQLELVARQVNVDLSSFYRQEDFAAQVERFGTLLLQNAFNIVTGVASAMVTAFLVLVLSFYMMVDGGALVDRLIAGLPLHMRAEPRYLLESIERTFGGFIRGQIIQSLIYGLGTAIVMLVLGLNFVLVSSIFAAAMMVLPFVGPFVAIIPPVIIAATTGSWTTVVVVLVLLLVLQQVVINVIAPKVLANAVGLPPLLVLVALLLGAKIAGVIGAIFGVPVVAILYAMLLFLYRRTAMYEQAKRGNLEL